MDTETLVKEQFESGQAFIERLLTRGFDVTVAFWLNESGSPMWPSYVSSGSLNTTTSANTIASSTFSALGSARSALWNLYIASSNVEREGAAKAYQVIFATLQSMPWLSLSMSQLKVIGANSPLASQVKSIQSRFPDTQIIRLGSTSLPGISIDDGFIYPHNLPAIRYEVLARWQEAANLPEELRRVGDFETWEGASQAIAKYSKDHEKDIGVRLKGYQMATIPKAPQGKAS